MPYKNKEDHNAYNRQWNLDNKERRVLTNKKWYLENKERLAAKRKQYYLDNKEKRLEKQKQEKQYRQDNPGKVNAKNAKRRAAKLNRTPSWADDLVIQMIYEDVPEGMEVDHIIPLQGKNVSGLHVAWNLQYLTPEENKMKGNKYE